MKHAPLHRKIATTITQEQARTTVTLYETQIVSFDAAVITLDSGGHRTVTTKRRINEAAAHYDLPISIGQTKHQWFIHLPGETPILFYDGIKISRDRTHPHPYERDEARAAAAAEAAAYNGHANRATWNVLLWLNNTEGYYRAYRAQARRRPFTPKSAYNFCLHIFRNGKTPDDQPLNKADWRAVSAALNEE